MKTIQYKGFIISACPQQLIENMQWTVNVHIEKHRGEKVSDKPFSTSNSFPSVEEATENCFNFGKQIIDGEIENCFVEDL